MNTIKNLFGNKVFRVCFVLLIITFPFASRYELIRTVGESMQPTFADGEWIILERKISLGKDWIPRRFDVVIINDDEENLTKRIVGKPGTLMFGLVISNIGSKISYSTSVNRDFIPMNLRLGSGIVIDADAYNQIGFQLEFTKLLVPTPPQYSIDANGSPNSRICFKAFR